MLGKVVGTIRLAIAPIYLKLTLSNSILDPIRTHDGPSDAVGIGFLGAHRGDDANVRGLASLWHGRGMDKEDCVAALDGAETLCQSSNFVGVGGLPDGTFTALAQFAVLRDHARVGIDRVSVKKGKVLIEQWGGKGRLLCSGVVKQERSCAGGDMIQVFGSCTVSMSCDDAGGLVGGGELFRMHCLGGMCRRGFLTLATDACLLFAARASTVFKRRACRGGQWCELNGLADCWHPQRCTSGGR